MYAFMSAGSLFGPNVSSNMRRAKAESVGASATVARRNVIMPKDTRAHTALLDAIATRENYCRMGLESRCAVRVDDGSVERADADARVELEGDALIVRGPARVRVPRSDITELVARDGVLTVTHAGGALHLSLGDAAEKWRAKILEGPRTRAQKLGVRPGMLVTLVGVGDPTIGREIVDAGGVLIDEHLRDATQPVDLLLLELASAADLALIARYAPAIGNGAMWVVHPNGVPELTDTRIFSAAESPGLVSTRTMSFSTGMSAERLSVRRTRT